jgi:hypothetical protein
MWFFFLLVVPPFVALPFFFLLYPTAFGALWWQMLSMCWMMFCFKKWG